MKIKKPASILQRESSNAKRMKEDSPQKFILPSRVQPPNTAVTKLRLEDKEYEAMEKASLVVNESSAVAGNQPRRQP